MPSACPTKIKPRENPEFSFKVRFLTAGPAACVAELVTFPIDVAKVRLQLQGEGVHLLFEPGHVNKYKGTFGTVRMIVQEEGFRGLYSGLTAGLQRQMCFSTIRLGFYDDFKRIFHSLIDSGPGTSMPVRTLSALSTGALSVLFAQPTDVVKVRMQGQGLGEPRYTGTLHAYRSIYVHEGVRGLWKGVLANMARNSIMAASELVAYDTLKDTLLDREMMKDSMPCHLVCGMWAGLCATIIASPVDVVKTRYMNSSLGHYAGAIDCALTMARHNGVRAFYKGCIPAFIRLSSWNVVTFVTYEQFKRLFSKEHHFDTKNLRPLPIDNRLGKIVTSSSVIPIQTSDSK